MKTVIQFNEKHKWCGHFGYIVETKRDGNYLINVSFIKEDKVANSYIIAKNEEFDYIGETDLISSLDVKEGEE